MDFKSFVDYIPFEEPLVFDRYKAVGYFPYEKAQLDISCVRVPFTLFDHIYLKLPFYDNKFVVIFECTDNYNEHFAIQFKDGYCKVGKHKQVRGYALRELKVINQ